MRPLDHSAIVPADSAEPPAPDWLNALPPTLEPRLVLEAWKESGQDPGRANTWLVDHGCVGARELGLLQAGALELPFVDVGEYRIEVQNRTLLPEEFTRAHTVFPLFVLDRIITLAVVWPLDLPVLDQVRLQTGCEVDQCLVPGRDIRHLIEWSYGCSQEQRGPRANTDIAWSEILKDVGDAPAVKLVEVLLEQAAGADASDIHVDAEEQLLRVRFRVDGMLREVPAPPKELLPALVSRIKVLASMDIAETRRPQDGHFKTVIDRQEIDIRVSTLPSANGEAVVLRLLRGAGRLLTLEELGMDAATQVGFDRLIRLPHGMVLVTGPTGSGKTTTLYSALSRVDRVRLSLITLEDPVEVRLPRMRQVAVNPKAGLTFESGLRSILRQDPDVIMLGEIRDRETAEIALQAALTGHLLLSTLHTNSSTAAPARLLDMGVPDFLVSSALVGVLAQRLCRRLCRHCAAPADDVAPLLALLPEAAAARLRDAPLQKAVGCPQCGHTGYDGRLGIFELLLVTDEMRREIVKGTDERTLQQMARTDGMRLLGEDGLEKVAAGRTTLEELLRVVAHVETTESSLVRTVPVAPAGLEPFDTEAYAGLLKRWLGLRSPAGGAPAPGLVGSARGEA